MASDTETEHDAWRRNPWKSGSRWPEVYWRTSRIGPEPWWRLNPVLGSGRRRWQRWRGELGKEPQSSCEQR